MCQNNAMLIRKRSISYCVMLERSILYTALTRAERLAVPTTQDKAVRIDVAQDRSAPRRTSLPRKLRVAMTESSPTETDSPPRHKLFDWTPNSAPRYPQ